MVSYYSSVTPVIRNHPIYMQYSTHKELKTDNSPNQVVSPGYCSRRPVGQPGNIWAEPQRPVLMP